MSEAITVGEGHVVLFQYTLKNEAGAVLDASQGAPMVYLHGHHNIVPGLEMALEGKAVGDKVHAVVKPEDGYGILREEASEKVPFEAFPPDMELQVGMPIRAETQDGHPMILWVEAVDPSGVTVTQNHPLAGQTLHFDVEITGIRVATSDEKVHGHAHGPDGHGHHH